MMYANEPSRSDPADEPNVGFTIRRRIGASDNFRRVYARRETLGAVAALINRCHAAQPSEWTVDGVRVPGTATAVEIHDALAAKALYGAYASEP